MSYANFEEFADEWQIHGLREDDTEAPDELERVRRGVEQELRVDAPGADLKLERGENSVIFSTSCGTGELTFPFSEDDVTSAMEDFADSLRED